MKIFFLISFLFITLSFANAINIDSLKAELPNKTDTSKLDLIYTIVENTNLSNPKESLHYAKIGLQLADSIKNIKRIRIFSNIIGVLYNERGEYKQARKYFEISLKESILISDSLNIARIYGNIGNTYLYTANYDNSIISYNKALIIFEAINDTMGQAQLYGVLGNLYLKNLEYDKALENYDRAIELFKQLDNKIGIATSYMNSGIIYRRKKEEDYDKAIELFTYSLKAYKEIGYRKGMALCYSNIGEVYFEKGKYREAIIEHSKANKIVNELNSYNQEILSLINLGECYQELNKLNIALNYYLLAYNKAKEHQFLESIESSSNKLANLYKLQKNYKKSLEYTEIYIDVYDSLFNIEKNNKFQEMLSKFESDQKEKEIELLKKTEELNKIEIEKNEAKINQQKIIIFSVVAIIVFVIFFIIIVLKQNKARKIANQRLQEKNEEINQQNEEIITQRDEIESQRDNVLRQKQIIETIHGEVSHSIDYAMKIQEAILSDKTVLTKYLSEHFVFFKPKDKVSGDFYWWANINNHTIITAADSTGHGVPGAFMSMLGISLLREIVQKEHITNTNLILERMREEIIKSLKQDDKVGGQKDGMDMAIVSINHETNIMQYSGANNPLYIVTERTLSGFKNLTGLVDTSSFKLYELRPNKMPIAIYTKMHKFTSHEIQLEKGDVVFMFSDGFADQFGGEKGKKFKYKPFKKLLLENAHKPMFEQKQILEQTFIDWKKNYDQIDDIVVLGFKL